jgi:hypothetical protein
LLQGEKRGIDMVQLRLAAYAVFATAGLVLPWIYGIQWVAAGGNILNFYSFFHDSFVPNGAAAFVTIDLLISWFTFLVFVLPESKRVGTPNGWIFFVLASTVGNCFAFPLFLFFRERRLAEMG